jgi:hypothetical protein
VDPYRDPEVGERGHDGGIEVGDRLRAQGQRPEALVAGRDDQAMVDEVEVDREGPRAVRDG